MLQKRCFSIKNVTRVAAFVRFLLEALVSRQFGGIGRRETATFTPPHFKIVKAKATFLRWFI